MSALAGRRVLVVEDEALVAIMVAEILEGEDAIVVGPAATVQKALVLMEDGPVDIAILDVNLRGESIDPIAHLLFEQGTPMIFATGYGQPPPGPWMEAPSICKPFTETDLIRAIRQVLGNTKGLRD